MIINKENITTFIAISFIGALLTAIALIGYNDVKPVQDLMKCKKLGYNLRFFDDDIFDVRTTVINERCAFKVTYGDVIKTTHTAFITEEKANEIIKAKEKEHGISK